MENTSWILEYSGRDDNNNKWNSLFYDDGSLSGIYARACHLHLHFAMRVFLLNRASPEKHVLFLSFFCSVMMRLSRFFMEYFFLLLKVIKWWKVIMEIEIYSFSSFFTRKLWEVYGAPLCSCCKSVQVLWFCRKCS